MHRGNRRSYGVDRSIGYIGMAQYEFRWGHHKDDYFAAVPRALADQRAVFDQSFDAVARFIDVLADVWEAPVTVAADDGRPYFAGIIRFAGGGIALHADYAPFNMPGYSVASINAQLAWNLFVEAPEQGGVTTIYNAPRTPTMTGSEPPKSYGLSREEMSGIEQATYCPRAGDVVLFNSRNPHEVSAAVPAGQGRLQVGSFAGLMPDGSLGLFA